MQVIKSFWSLSRNSGRTGIVAMLSLVFPLIGAGLLVGFLQDLTALREYAGDPKFIGCFILAATILVGTSLIPTHILALTGGWLFGFKLGLFYSFSGISLAAITGFFISRWLCCEKLSIHLEQFERFQVTLNHLKKKPLGTLWGLISLIRLSPVIPFAMTNVMLASLKIPFHSFFAGTLLGMLPRTALMVFAGAGLHKLDFNQKSGVQGLIIGLVGTIALLYLISRVAKKALAKQLNEKN